MDCLALKLEGSDSRPVCSSELDFGSEFDGNCRRSITVGAPRAAVRLHYGFVWYSATFEERLKETVRQGDYDVIFGVSSTMAYYLRCLTSPPVVVDLIDAEEMACRRTLAHATVPRDRLRALRNLVLFQFFKKRVLRAHKDKELVVVSEVDAEFLCRHLGCSRLHVIPLGVEPCFLEPFREKAMPEEPGVLMFHGSLGAPHNHDAAMYLLSEIYPRVLRSEPYTALWVVGPGARAPLLKLAARFPKARVPGYEPNVKPWLEKASVYVCPHTTGSGMKTKLLEAWAMGKAAVASPRALEGLAAQDQVNVLVARTPEQFATAIMRLLRDPELRRHIGREARKTVAEHYSALAQSQKLEALLASVASQGSPTQAPIVE